MVLLPSDPKRKRRIKEWGRATTGQVSPKGTVEIWEHWDGSRDAVVKPKAFRIAVKAEKDLAPLIGELEAAIRENDLALRSKDRGWHRRSAARVNAARQRLQERA